MMEHFFVIYRVENCPQTVVRRISVAQDRVADDLLRMIDEEGEKVRKLCGKRSDVFIVQMMQFVPTALKT